MLARSTSICGMRSSPLHDPEHEGLVDEQEMLGLPEAEEAAGPVQVVVDAGGRLGERIEELAVDRGSLQELHTDVLLVVEELLAGLTPDAGSAERHFDPEQGLLVEDLPDAAD